MSEYSQQISSENGIHQSDYHIRYHNQKKMNYKESNNASTEPGSPIGITTVDSVPRSESGIPRISGTAEEHVLNQMVDVGSGGVTYAVKDNHNAINSESNGTPISNTAKMPDSSFEDMKLTFIATSTLIEKCDKLNRPVVLSAETENLDSSTKCMDGVKSLALLCRLCAAPCDGPSSPFFLFKSAPHHPEVILNNSAHQKSDEEEKEDILEMIRKTLPIKVSCCDLLPKQVCLSCSERVRSSYLFWQSVLDAENQLKVQSFNSKAKEDSQFPLSSFNPKMSYDCPLCCEPDNSAQKRLEEFGNSSSSTGLFNSGDHVLQTVIKIEPEDVPEPSCEELEQSYNKLFGEHNSLNSIQGEEHSLLQSFKDHGTVTKKNRGRPRSKPKVTPRGRRGRRSTHTTVERILEVTQGQVGSEGYSIRVCSGERNPSLETLTQCLLCERWLPGAAECLQHSLGEHSDCGAFLCPCCPRDDFPGDFELIQHYQEAHCPDLELYESWENGRSDRAEGEMSSVCASFGHPMSLEHNTMIDTLKISRKSSDRLHEETMDVGSSGTTTFIPDNFNGAASGTLGGNKLFPSSNSKLFNFESGSISTPQSDRNVASTLSSGGDIFQEVHVSSQNDTGGGAKIQ